MSIYQIIESYDNGQKKQFLEQVKEYGVIEFCECIKNESFQPETIINMQLLVIKNLIEG